MLNAADLKSLEHMEQLDFMSFDPTVKRGGVAAAWRRRRGMVATLRRGGRIAVAA